MIRNCNLLLVAVLATLLCACGSLPSQEPRTKVGAGGTAGDAYLPDSAREVVMTALGMLETGYRFGGKNPEAGLDCSGMVNYVFASATRKALGSSAADIAQRGRVLGHGERRPGDLVFFNTSGQAALPYSHVGIYIGDERFIHAPSSRGQVRIDRLDRGWFATRLTEARRYIE